MYFQRVPLFFQNLFTNITWSSVSDPRLHLTFDDGPHPESTPLLLDLLDVLNRKATFFCLGCQLSIYPELGMEIRARGHLLANHGYHHISGWRTATKSYILNATQGAEISNSNNFRPPYGRLKPYQFFHLKEKYELILWSVMPGDFDVRVSKEELTERLSKSTPQDIIALHDSPSTIEKLTYALIHCYG